MEIKTMEDLLSRMAGDIQDVVYKLEQLEYRLNDLEERIVNIELHHRPEELRDRLYKDNV
jgi:hypothetical protein